MKRVKVHGKGLEFLKQYEVVEDLKLRRGEIDIYLPIRDRIRRIENSKRKR